MNNTFCATQSKHNVKNKNYSVFHLYHYKQDLFVISIKLVQIEKNQSLRKNFKWYCGKI